MIRSVLRASALVAVAAVIALPAHAQYTFVSSRAGIGGSSVLNWGALGPDETQVASGTAGIAISNSALTATVTSGITNPMEIRTQGMSWGGNFAPGSAVLWTRGENGTLTTTFSGAVGAAGADFTSNYYGPFTAQIEALGASQNVLATFMFSGTMDGGNDGSAPFAGISSALNDIYAIRFTGLTASFAPTDFAITNMSVNGDVGVVPEPSTYALMGTGFAGLLGIARRRRAAAV